jgi:hypothetical protein
MSKPMLRPRAKSAMPARNSDGVETAADPPGWSRYTVVRETRVNAIDVSSYAVAGRKRCLGRSNPMAPVEPLAPTEPPMPVGPSEPAGRSVTVKPPVAVRRGHGEPDIPGSSSPLARAIPGSLLHPPGSVPVVPGTPVYPPGPANARTSAYAAPFYNPYPMPPQLGQFQYHMVPAYVHAPNHGIPFHNINPSYHLGQFQYPLVPATATCPLTWPLFTRPICSPLGLAKSKLLPTCR